MSLIKVVKLGYTYGQGSGAPVQALRGIDLEISHGEYVAIIGRNGSGKSTLAKCLNGLLLPTEGDVWVEGMNTKDATSRLKIRETVGMVFQNPDNQFIATTVEEEIAFGPENLGLPRDILIERVEWALREVGLEELRHRDPQRLSAGQKARVAIASVLAMQPACLVLDEATALLDPLARQGVLDLLSRLHHEGLTIVSITHLMDEIVRAQRVCVLAGGSLVLEGSPREVFSQEEMLVSLGLDLPPAATVARGLRQRGLGLARGLLTPRELAEAVCLLSEVPCG